MFSDNFKIRATVSIREEVGGGLVVKEWADAMWVKPMPMRHGLVKRFIEKRIQSDATKFGTSFVRTLGEKASGERSFTNCQCLGV